SRLDRQIILVDVLSALHAGREVFSDVQQAIKEIALCYRYAGPLSKELLQLGNSAYWPAKVLGRWHPALGVFAYGALLASPVVRRVLSRHINRVVFAATKADHVPEGKRDSLRLLMLDMLGETEEAVRSTSTPTEAITIAS